MDFDLDYLQAELSRIDVLIKRQVRCWQLAGQDPLDDFRGLHLSDDEAHSLLERPFSTSWGQTVSLPPAEAEWFAQNLAASTRHIEQLRQQAPDRPRLLRLAETFQLNRFELDTLLVCLAPTLDLRYESLYGYLQDDVTRKRPTVDLMLNLLADPGPARLQHLGCFAEDATLLKYKLLDLSSDSEHAPLLSHTLRVDEALVAWLLGRYQPHAALGQHAALYTIEPEAVDHLLARPVAADLEQIASTPQPPLLVMHGPDRASQKAAARLIAAERGQALLTVNIAGVLHGELTPPQAVRLALRDAYLTGAVPALFGWDSCLKEGELAPALLAELCAFPGLVVVAGQTRWQAEGIDRERPLFWLEFSLPAYPQRLALWHHFLGLETPPDAWHVDSLAAQFSLSTRQISDAVASARDLAAQRAEPLNGDDLFAAARSHSNPRLATLARKIVPRYDWEDIILAPDQLAILREIVATVRERPKVLEEWGVGKKLASSAAITVLFAGEPGTGKTMAAEVMATELGLDLYKIDLSTVVSKYIGETEKNLERIFTEAETSNAILFFDEADAIFGKRSEVKDAHDRYANIEVSYLLQRMEAYDGVTILATNLRANLDDAFTRRLQFVIDFPFPDEVYRLRIWETLFPPTVPCEDDLNFNWLARRFKLAGGNIRNIIVSAAYLAAADGGQVSMDHLLHSTRRELQKMGRLVNEADLRINP